MTMQDGRLSTLERAFQIAREGTARSVQDIRDTLRSEHCEGVDQHLSGMAIKKQLTAAIAARLRA